MTTIEKNKVIAEFMGIIPIEDSIKAYEYFYIDSPWFYSRGSFMKVQNGIHNYVKYHSSWDWLMPVIQKLYQQADPIFRDSEAECKSALCYEPIEEVHKIVYQWITKINEANNA